MIEERLIGMAENHLRRKHSAGRRAELIRNGIPADDPTALAEWLRAALRCNEDALAANGAGVFHACVVRQSSGTDHDLPTKGGFGCRVTFVPLAAQVAINDGDGDSPDECGEVHWLIRWGNCGPGFQEPTFVRAPADADPAAIVSSHRERMLRRADIFASRVDADAAVVRMLELRAQQDADHG